MPRISAKNQVTIPVAILHEAGFHPGDHVLIDALDEGELRLRRGERSFEDAFGVLTGIYPPDYLKQLDADDEPR